MAGLPVGQPVDPWSAGIMGAASVAGKALDDKTNQTQTNTFSAAFDNSGWSINLGDGASQTTSATRTNSPIASGLGSILNNPVLLLALCAAAYFVLKRK